MGGFNSATIVALIVFVVALIFALKRSKKGFKGCDGCTSKDCNNCTKVNDLHLMYEEGKRKEQEELERLGLEDVLKEEMDKNNK